MKIFKRRKSYFGKMAFTSLFLFILTNKSCQCGQIASRFSYNMESSLNDDEVQGEEASGDETNVKLIDEEIPMEFFQKLDNITDPEEYDRQFMSLTNPKDEGNYKADNYKRNVERALVVKPTPAHCSLQNVTVRLTPLNPEKNALYTPPCTRVPRCNGCCHSHLMSCQATEKEYVNFEILKYNPSRRSTSKEIVVIEVHTACRCSCRLKAEDCKFYEIYRPDECRCRCRNEEDNNKCSQEGKIWNQQTCSCVCSEVQSCTTGTFFDENECRCVQNNSTEESSDDRRRFIVKAIPVDPDYV